MEKRKIRIVFMGTPDFAVASLKALLDEQYEVAAVVTAPDRPAGRGLQLRQSPVKEFALQHQLKVLQPEKLKSPSFEKELDATGANLYVVVAFRMLPESVWNRPAYGTFNLHASLLPDYRGAAPINRAIMNGEITTGVTTFFLNEEIDTGKIIFQEQVSIGADTTAGQLHDELMETGARLVVKTVKAIEENTYVLTDQSKLIEGKAKQAPKLFAEDCKIDWSLPAKRVYDHIRGLNPYPGAWSNLRHKNSGKALHFKVYDCQPKKEDTGNSPGAILTDGKSSFRIVAGDGKAINIEVLQIAGKKKMTTSELLRGFHIKEYMI